MYDKAILKNTSPFGCGNSDLNNFFASDVKYSCVMGIPSLKLKSHSLSEMAYNKYVKTSDKPIQYMQKSLKMGSHSLAAPTHPDPGSYNC